MISKEHIEQIIKNQQNVTGIFVVDVQIRPGNSIVVVLDRPEGINIRECSSISRIIENHFDREQEDFELQVTSPGLDQPFKVIEQYYKNVGRQVEVVKNTGDKQKGILTSVNTNNIELEITEKIKTEGKKGKQLNTRKLIIAFDEIKSTRVVISFN